jgi:hypothetical protein
VFRLDEEFFGDDACLVFVLFDLSRLDDFLPNVIYCHSGVPQGNHLGHLFFINNVDEVFRIFQHASALSHADDLKLFITKVLTIATGYRVIWIACRSDALEESSA